MARIIIFYSKENTLYFSVTRYFLQNKIRKDAHWTSCSLSSNLIRYHLRYPVPYNRDNIEGVVRYRHIGIYGFRHDYLFEFASQERTYLEKCENLEQLRALENGVKIKVVKTDYNPLSVDTLEDLQNILKILKNSKVESFLH